jgi:CRP-like cAMP-binding protein
MSAASSLLDLHIKTRNVISISYLVDEDASTKKKNGVFDQLDGNKPSAAMSNLLDRVSRQFHKGERKHSLPESSLRERMQNHEHSAKSMSLNSGQLEHLHKSALQKPTHTRTPADIELIQRWLEKTTTSGLLHKLHVSLFASLCAQAQYEKDEAGHIVFRDGDEADKFYIIMSGKVSVWMLQGGKKKLRLKNWSKVKKAAMAIGGKKARLKSLLRGFNRRQQPPALLPDKEGTHHYKLLGEMHAGQTFGELGLLSGKPRGALIRCDSVCELLAINKSVFDSLIRGSFGKSHVKPGLLKKFDVFRDINVAGLSKVENLFEARHYGPARVILTEGKHTDSIFFLISGQCKLVKQTEEKERATVLGNRPQLPQRKTYDDGIKISELQGGVHFFGALVDADEQGTLDYSVITLNRCEILVVKKEQLQRKMNVKFWKMLIQTSAVLRASRTKRLNLILAAQQRESGVLPKISTTHAATALKSTLVSSTSTSSISSSSSVLPSAPVDPSGASSKRVRLTHAQRAAKRQLRIRSQHRRAAQLKFKGPSVPFMEDTLHFSKVSVQSSTNHINALQQVAADSKRRTTHFNSIRQWDGLIQTWNAMGNRLSMQETAEMMISRGRKYHTARLRKKKPRHGNNASSGSRTHTAAAPPSRLASIGSRVPASLLMGGRTLLPSPPPTKKSQNGFVASVMAHRSLIVKDPCMTQDATSRKSALRDELRNNMQGNGVTGILRHPVYQESSRSNPRKLRLPPAFRFGLPKEAE